MEQATRLEEIFQNTLPGLRKQKEALDVAEAEFNRLVSKGDHAATLTQVDVVEGRRRRAQQVTGASAGTHAAGLTADQHAKFDGHSPPDRQRGGGDRIDNPLNDHEKLAPCSLLCCPRAARPARRVAGPRPDARRSAAAR